MNWFQQFWLFICCRFAMFSHCLVEDLLRLLSWLAVRSGSSLCFYTRKIITFGEKGWEAYPFVTEPELSDQRLVSILMVLYTSKNFKSSLISHPARIPVSHFTAFKKKYFQQTKSECKRSDKKETLVARKPACLSTTYFEEKKTIQPFTK